MNETPQQTIDRHIPPCGSCAFCGYSDARHRIFDAIAEQYQAGDTIEEIADNFNLAIEVVEAVIGMKSNGLAIDSRTQ